MEIKVGDIFENVDGGYTFDPSTIQILKINTGSVKAKVIKSTENEDYIYKDVWAYTFGQITEAKKQEEEKNKMRFNDEVLEEGTLAVVTGTWIHNYDLETIVVAAGKLDIGSNMFKAVYPKHRYESQLISLTEVEIVEFENPNQKTLEAIEGSIKKWEDIIGGYERNCGYHNCPLCHKFHSVFVPQNYCEACPIKQVTGKSGCLRTPYCDYEETPSTSNAEAELEFLKAIHKAYKLQMKKDPEPKFKAGDFVRLKKDFKNLTRHGFNPLQIVKIENHIGYEKNYNQNTYNMVGFSKFGTKLPQIVTEDDVEPYEFTFSAHSEKTMNAIEGSVKKWEDVVLGKIKERGPNNCPLCELFFENPSCSGCPIAEKPRYDRCLNTPYTKWIETSDYNNGRYVASLDAYKTALDEIEFLKNILRKYKEELEICQL